MINNIIGANKDNQTIYLFMDNAGYHRNEELVKYMKENNIIPVYNVSYHFMFNPIERLWAQYKNHFRRVLLEKMLDYPEAKSTPLKDALH